MNCASSKNAESSALPGKKPEDKSEDLVEVEQGTDQFEFSEENSPFTEHVDFTALRNDSGSWPAAEPDTLEVSEDLILQYLQKGERAHLKSAIRSGSWLPSHGLRGSLWKKICKHLYKADSGDIYEDYEKELFGEDAGDEVRLPPFVDFSHLEHYRLTTEGAVLTRKILAVIELSSPDITYCPMLCSIASVFLHYMSVSDCYNCVYALLRSKDTGFMTQTKTSYEASKLVIRDLTKRYAKSAYVYIARNSSSMDKVFDDWVWWILQDLPFHALVRVMDCYLVEGIKILYRVALAILILYVKYSGKKAGNQKAQEAGDSVHLVNSIRQFCREMPVKLDKVFKVGFSVGFGMRGLTRKEIRKLQVKHEMYLNSQKRVHDSSGILPMSRSFSGPIVLQNIPSAFLTPDMLYTIWTWLPTRYAVCQPELLYTSEEHGTSLMTLYTRVENHQPTVIVIKTTKDEIFGAFCSTYWSQRRQSTKNLSYFGTGETFIFTLSPDKKKYEWVGLTQENIPNTANMFQAGDKSVLTIGGGHGAAIQLDETMLHCRTEPCDTFDNALLCSSEDFQCMVVEVYGFQ